MSSVKMALRKKVSENRQCYTQECARESSVDSLREIYWCQQGGEFDVFKTQAWYWKADWPKYAMKEG